MAVAVDAAGTVYVTDRSNVTIRRIMAAGVVTTLAGTAGSSGSTGAAASFNIPASVAVDAAGTVCVADQNAGVDLGLPTYTRRCLYGIGRCAPANSPRQ